MQVYAHVIPGMQADAATAFDAEGRCDRIGPDLRIQMVAGAGFEPATFGL
jgi:hypothetical protein